MNNITRFRKDDYDHALLLAEDGQRTAALKILWDLRLKVDLSIYRRALVNITLSTILGTPDGVKYAQECLDLLDLLRQQIAKRRTDEEELEHIAELEELAKDVIDTTVGVKKASNNTLPSIRLDADTGLLSEGDFDTYDSPTPSTPASALKNDPDLSPLPDDIEGPQDEEGEYEIWELEPEPLQPVTADLPCIEGFLRDTYYTKLEPYCPPVIVDPERPESKIQSPRPSTPEPRNQSIRQITPSSSSPPPRHE